MKTISLIAAALIGTGALVGGAQAQDKGSVNLGALSCVIDGGTGFVIGSSKELGCTFQPATAGSAPETYVGRVDKFGLDIGKTEKTVMQWAVLGPSITEWQPGALAGDYVGASAEATVGAGAGANVLVGGSATNFTLQPVSVQAQTGLNLAAGVTSFKLRAM